MRKRWMRVIGVLMLIMVGSFLTASPALADKWHLDLEGGYGRYSLSWGKPNEFIRSFNSWLKDTCGVSDFEIEEMQENATLYSLGSKLTLPDPLSRLQIGLDLNYREARETYVDEYLTVPLEGGAERSVRVLTYLSDGVVFGDLILYYKFGSRLGLVPFIGAGPGYYATAVYGNYRVEEETYTPPEDWEFRYLSERFSATGFSSGYVLAAGVESSGEYIRLRLEARYHQISKIEARFENVENEGFPSLPFEPESSEVDISGWSISGWLVFHF